MGTEAVAQSESCVILHIYATDKFKNMPNWLGDESTSYVSAHPSDCHQNQENFSGTYTMSDGCK
jgi:hypothetical protein